MCFVALGALASGGALAAGSGAGLFGMSLALSAGTQILGAAAKNRVARQQASYAYQAAERTALSADAAMTAQQEALNAQLQERRADAAQKKLAKTVEGLRARGKVAATEGRSGRLMSLIQMDVDRQVAGMRESLSQSLESAEVQYGRDVAGIVAQRDSRRNQATDTANRGYMEAQKNYQGLLPTIANVASSGLSTYLDINPMQKTFTKGS
tara:strand:- start:11437 stop:12066 length:630 start_codon:yes stop_codon:yes gene_type:complete